MDNLRISTMTACSSINSDINLDNLYQNLNTDSVISFIQHGALGHKGELPKTKRKPRKTVNRKTFFNQVTLHVFCSKKVNVKLFNNGKVQMTGLKYEEHGADVLDILIPTILRTDKAYDNKILDTDTIKYTPINIACINSDFSIGYPIKREVLYSEIVNLGYYSSYEPCIYPGVNSKYYYNKSSDDGICHCINPCTGKGDGCSDGGCKKITIAVFKSGETIITGARSREQLNIAHKFITNFVKERVDILKLT